MAGACVIRDAEFKNKAKSLGITGGQLNNILHEYINSPYLQSHYTEDEFISTKLDGISPEGVSDIQKEAWDKVYQQPIAFDTFDEYSQAASAAEAVFGKDAIGHRETPEGKHILKVAKPVERIQQVTADKTPTSFTGHIKYIPYKRTGETIDSVDKGKSICNATQVLCIEMIADAFNNGDLAHNVKAWPVSIDAKSPLEDSIIDHSTTIVKVNGEYYLFDMPQSEFITPTGRTFTQYGKEFNEGIIGDFKPRLIPIKEDTIQTVYQIDDSHIKNTMNSLLSKIEDLNKRTDFEITVEEDINTFLTSQESIETQQEEQKYNGIRAINQDFIRRNLLREQGVRALYDNKVGLTTAEITYEAKQLSYWITDTITDLFAKPEDVYNKFDIAKTNNWATEEDKKKDIDAISKLSRRELISKITFNKLRDAYKREMFEDNEHLWEDISIRDLNKVNLLADNIDVLFDLSMSTFAQSEGFSISYNDKLNTYQATDADGNNALANDEIVDIAEIMEEGTKLEDWMIDKASVEVLGTATAQVRAALSRAFETDKDGNEIVDYLGRKVRLSQNDAVKSIIRWTQGAQNINDMIQMLDQKAYDHSWLIQILDRLEDKTGKETDFISQFYSTFQKHFVYFDIVRRNKDNRYYFMDVNNRPALNYALDEVLVNFQLGLSPMFTSEGFHKENLEWLNQCVDFLLNNRVYNISEEDFKANKNTIISLIKDAAFVLGYDITEDNVAKSVNRENLKDVIDALQSIRITFNERRNVNGTYNPFVYKKDRNAGSVYGYLKKFLGVITESVEDTTESSFYEAGKMRQSYQVPAYITKLFGKLSGNQDLFENTIDTEFRPYEWFFKDGRWNNSLLRDLASMPEEQRKNILRYKRNLKFLKDQYMQGMSQEKYGISVLTEFANPSQTGNVPIGYYRLPIQSNKATSDFYSFYKYNDAFYKSTILSNLLLTFGQELSRMTTVEKRARQKGDVDYIANFDGERGRKFCFLDFLNDLPSLVNGVFTESAALELQRYIDDTVKGIPVSAEESVRFNELAKQAIESGLDRLVEQTKTKFKSLGMYEAIGNIEGVVTDTKNAEKQIEDFIENFVWNDTLASTNITQLLVTDLAYYEDSDDFQKRFAQVHSPGVRGNEFATVYDNFGVNSLPDGRVSDGKIRVSFLGDYETYKTNIMDNLEVVLDKNIAQATSTEAKRVLTELKGTVLHGMEKINVTDGQAFISPTGARKIGYMYGKWSRELEDTYKRVVQGNYSVADLTALTNVRKPFIYSQIGIDTDTEGAPLQNLKMGVQVKDSEYMLALAGAILRDADTGIPNMLKILYEVMEESAFNSKTPNGTTLDVYNGKGIDIFAFNSAVKTGLVGSLDVTTKWANGDYTKESVQAAEAELKGYLLNQLYENEDGMIDRTNPIYKPFVVKEIPVEDYATQVENPFHMLDEAVIWGSQMRAIIESNLAYTDSEGNPVVFSWTDSKGNTHSVGREDFRKAYEENAAKFVELHVNRAFEEFGINVTDSTPADKRASIAKALQEEIMKNIERYGPDMLLACSINEEGKFNLPPGDPTQSKRIQQLVNSIVKNRINKPKVSGGMAIQTSSFGMSDQLHIRFFSKDGKTLLPTKEEWLKDNPNGDYWAYCKENQGGVAYEENYSPVTRREFFDFFRDWDGQVDIEAIEMLDENLLFSIDQRTPTEFYYSISVAKIKDFLPVHSGDGFMRPYEITEIDDSDFDNDKQTKWWLNAEINRNKDVKFGVQELIDAVPELQALDKKVARNVARKFLSDDIDKFQKSYETDYSDIDKGLFKEMKRAWIKAKFSVEYPTEGENAILNDSWRMSLASLQSESNAAKMLSPGGNSDLANQGYLIESTLILDKSYDEIAETYTPDDMKNIVKNADKNLMFFINQMEYYQRNNDASSNLGIFAVAATSHNILEGEHYALSNEKAFTIAGKEYRDIIEFDPTYDSEGILVSKSLGANVSGAADAAKVPSHALLNINGNTINEYLVLLRTGMPMYKAATFIATKPLKDLVRRVNSSNVEKNVSSMKKVVEARVEELKKEFGKESKIYDEELTWEEIKSAITNGEVANTVEFKILLAFQRLSDLSEGMRAFTFATRYNSIASAVGPLIIDNHIHDNNFDKYNKPPEARSDGSMPTGTLMKTGYTIYDASDNNTKKVFGETVTDFSGNEIVITPDNLIDLETKGLIKATPYYDTVILDDVLNDHPMLKAFKEGHYIAAQLFDILEMPLASDDFWGIINEPLYSDFMFRNRDGLNKFSEFYLSYLLVQSGIINADPALKNDGPQYYIRKFPSDFMQRRDTYKGNALIDAIRPRLDDGVLSLELKTSGMKIDEKTELQSAWLDLYRKNPRFALALFKYNFWKGGLGFSPKTFMNIIPIQLKQQIDGYADTYNKNAPKVSHLNVLDQFFRNNAKDNNLIRFVSDFSKGDYDFNKKTGEIKFGSSWFDELKGSPFIKYKRGKNIILLKVIERDDANRTLKYIETTGLGNNGEFLEISTRYISKSFIDSAIADTEGEGTDGIPTQETYSQGPRTEEQMRKEAEEYASYFRDPISGNLLRNANGTEITAESLVSWAMDAKRENKGADPNFVATQRDRTKALFERNGIPYTEDKITDIVKSLC